MPAGRRVPGVSKWHEMREAVGMIRLRLAGWFGGLTVALVGALALGQGALAAPDLRRPSTWSTWASERTPAEAAIAVVRLTVVVLAVYLLVATMVAVVTRLGDTAADIVTLPFVRGIVQGVLGVGIAGAALAGAVSHPAPSSPRTPAAAVALVQEDAPLPPPPASGHVFVPQVDESVTRTWTVAPGESFWSIAERNAPDGADVAMYWRTLIDANRDRLADPGNPDLLFPGQELSLPSGA